MPETSFESSDRIVSGFEIFFRKSLIFHTFLYPKRYGPTEPLKLVVWKKLYRFGCKKCQKSKIILESENMHQNLSKDVFKSVIRALDRILSDLEVE